MQPRTFASIFQYIADIFFSDIFYFTQKNELFILSIVIVYRKWLIFVFLLWFLAFVAEEQVSFVLFIYFVWMNFFLEQTFFVQALYRNFEWSLKYLLFRSVCIFADNYSNCRRVQIIISSIIFLNKWMWNGNKMINLVKVMRLSSWNRIRCIQIITHAHILT